MYHAKRQKLEITEIVIKTDDEQIKWASTLKK